MASGRAWQAASAEGQTATVGAPGTPTHHAQCVSRAQYAHTWVWLGSRTLTWRCWSLAFIKGSHFRQFYLLIKKKRHYRERGPVRRMVSRDSRVFREGTCQTSDHSDGSTMFPQLLARHQSIALLLQQRRFSRLHLQSYLKRPLARRKHYTEQAKLKSDELSWLE